MKVLDLFSGLGGWSQAFKDRGHEVVTIDNNPKFNPTYCEDIMNVSAESLKNKLNLLIPFDVILASPPCEHFSVMAISKHWSKDGLPNEETKKSIELVKHTQQLIHNLNPEFYFIENPMGMMRRVIGKPTATITQCQYGNPYMKMTDLWGKFPKSFTPKKCNYGDPCHPRTPRGSNTSGIQKLKTREERALIPYGLSLAVCVACENEHNDGGKV